MPSPLSALSPLDGRYHKQLAPLAAYCSEAALIRYRVRVEIEWLIALAQDPALAELRPFSTKAVAELRQAAADFAEADAARVKEIEAAPITTSRRSSTGCRERFAARCRGAHGSNGCISAAPRRTSTISRYALMLTARARRCCCRRSMRWSASCGALAHRYADVAMLARTHGQAATPTTVGKEIANVVAACSARARASPQSHARQDQRRRGQFQRAPRGLSRFDWAGFARAFVESLRLEFNRLHHADRAARLDGRVLSTPACARTPC